MTVRRRIRGQGERRESYIFLCLAETRFNIINYPSGKNADWGIHTSEIETN